MHHPHQGVPLCSMLNPSTRLPTRPPAPDFGFDAMQRDRYLGGWIAAGFYLVGERHQRVGPGGAGLGGRVVSRALKACWQSLARMRMSTPQ